MDPDKLKTSTIRRMRLYFARHGQTNANVDTLNGKMIAELDLPLNENGIEQSKVLADELKDSNLDVIICSPLLRARQTAEIVNQYHGLPIKIDDSWRERYAGDNIDAARWNDLFDFDKNIPVENGESLDEFFRRIYSAIEKTKLEQQGRNVLVVSHGGVQHAVYAYMNKCPLLGNMRISPLKNGGVRVYDV